MREKVRPHMNVGTIGHVDSGKSALTAAIRHLQKCSWCGGRGTEADYVGLEMKCVEVDCSKCGGTGKTA